MSQRHGLLLCLLLFCASPGSRSANIHGLEYDPNDFVVAQPTCVHRLPLAQVSRQWRGKGIRSFTVLNSSKLADDLNHSPSSREHREAYGYWEDDSLARGSWRGGNVGDTRAAVTPFLAHQYFGETYKWMLYGDDDTIFYMPGVLKLLSQFDPEQPLAITDNIWYYALHPSPSAPRCLPCGFNTSTIATNHSFTPRPACPFCTRALACGTYSPRYRCNDTHMQHFAEAFGPNLTTFRPAADSDAWQANGASGGSDGSSSGAETSAEGHEDNPNDESSRERYSTAMRDAASRYADWMSRHVDIKARYPREFRYKPAMDWEMRDPPLRDGSGSDPGSGSGEEAPRHPADEHSETRYRRRRRRQRNRALLVSAEARNEAGFGGDYTDDDDGPEAWQLDQDVIQQEQGQRQRQGQQQEQRRRQQQGQAQGQQRGRRLAGRYRPKEQPYLDGFPWMSAALGRDVSQDAGFLEELKLPHPFCARHDDRLHSRAAPNCLVSISGHGGTGIIFSVGLLRMLAPEEAIRFITKQTGCGGGDCLLGRALWFRMGVGFTDPGTALQNGAERYETYSRFIDSNLQMSQLLILADPVAALLNRRKPSARKPGCDKACVWLIENVVGTHVRAQLRQVNATVDAMVKHLRTHARAYEWVREARREPEVAAGRVSVIDWIQGRYQNASWPEDEGGKG